MLRHVLSDGVVSPVESGAATTTPVMPALLQLADGRFPTGGHAHSGGFEAAAERERTRDEAGLTTFLEGRLHTVGRVAAAFTAAACHGFATLSGGSNSDQGLRVFVEQLDDEFNARTPSPVLRTVSRRLGRQVIRAGRTVWPSAVLDALASWPAKGLHQPIAFGAVAASAGQSPVNAAMAAAQEAVSGPATASIRLLGLDPFRVNAVIAGMAGQIEDVAWHSAQYATADPVEFPSHAGYLLDISAEIHATWEVRLFAS